MRIITGKFKKANLYAVTGNKTRPTTDFLKEVIFSVIPDCYQKKTLDLYAGSGSLGLEALSRGASLSIFVDYSEKAIKTIRQNIIKLKCENDCKIYKKRVSAFIKTEPEKYDLIFMDPPYNKNLINPTIELVFQNNLIDKNGIIIVEHSRNEYISYFWKELIIYNKIYGESAVTILDSHNYKGLSNNETL
jgi:16S rRNA (guanine966-N2)-methyltransferase